MEFTKGERQVIYNATKERFEVRIFQGKNCLGTLATFKREGDAILDRSAPDLYKALKTLVEKYWMNKETDGLNGFIACITPEGIPEYWQVADKALTKAEEKQKGGDAYSP